MDIHNKKFRTAGNLKEKYHVIYDETFNTSFTGIHSTILHFLKPHINKDSNILDVGCGAGRLSIYLSKFAGHIDAFDYSKKAIETAKKFSEATSSKNINFFTSDMNKFTPNNKYDIITISEVIEHVDSPIETLKKYSQYLEKDGIIVLSCPNFENFKGGIYMTMKKLFGIPMSLTDVRQVFKPDIIDWCKHSELKLDKLIGNCYDWGWSNKFYLDMKRRIPLAIKDVPGIVPFTNFEKMNKWMIKMTPSNNSFLNFLIDNGFLKTRRDFNIINFCKQLSEEAKEYILDGKLKDNLHFCDTEPFNSMGGDSIYFLKKLN